MHKILVVDDDPEIRKILLKALTQFGYDVTDAKNGTEGFDLLFSDQFDVAIIDILMPEMDGVEFINKIGNEISKEKIVVMSGGLNKIDGIKYFKVLEMLGIQFFLKKPFSIHELKDMVHSIIYQGSGSHSAH